MTEAKASEAHRWKDEVEATLKMSELITVPENVAQCRHDK